MKRQPTTRGNVRSTMALKDRQHRRVGKEGRMQDWFSGGEGEDVSTMEAVVIRWGVGLELDTTEPMP